MSNVIIKATNDQLSQMKAYYRSYLLNKQIPYTCLLYTSPSPRDA